MLDKQAPSSVKQNRQKWRTESSLQLFPFFHIDCDFLGRCLLEHSPGILMRVSWSLLFRAAAFINHFMSIKAFTLFSPLGWVPRISNTAQVKGRSSHVAHWEKRFVVRLIIAQTMLWVLSSHGRQPWLSHCGNLSDGKSLYVWQSGKVAALHVFPRYATCDYRSKF